MHMPEIDGVELMRNIHIIEEYLPVVVISGYDDFNYVRGSLVNGAANYLLKHELSKGKLLDVRSDSGVSGGSGGGGDKSVVFSDQDYMYYSNVPAGGKDCHEECLKLAVSDKPEGPFVWKKDFFEKFSIDSHPMMWNEKMYMFYSVNDWIGTDEKISGNCILVDEMITPEEFAGNPQEVVLPGLPQEIYEANRFGDGRDWYTIEGAAPVVRGKYTWMLYSANAYVNEDYFVGTAVAGNRERCMLPRFILAEGRCSVRSRLRGSRKNRKNRRFGCGI